MVKKILLYGFCFFLFVSAFGAVVEAPSLRCVSVLSKGDVVLTWVIPPDFSGSFNSYHIYSSSNLSGPYKVLDSIFSYKQTTYTDTSADGRKATVYYYVKSRSDSSGFVFSASSDTLQSMLLDVNSPGNGTAKLAWNSIHGLLLSTSSGNYHIYREYPLNNLLLIDSVKNTAYINPISFCNDTASYQVRISDNSGCYSISSADGGKFQDIIPPSIPVIDSVSIDSSGTVVLGWDINPASDTKCYIIYRLIGGIWKNTDTVCGINNTFLKTDMVAASMDSFRVVAFDSCGNTSPFGFPHNSVFLTGTLDVCSSAMNMTWNKYINWNGGAASYSVYASENGSAFYLLDSVVSGITSYTHTSLTPSASYCYYIQAKDASRKKTASSNRICITASIPKPPQFLYLKTATVSEKNTIRIDWFADTSADVTNYELHRAKSLNGAYSKITALNVSAEAHYSYIDQTALPETESYYYKVIAVNSCGTAMRTSNTGRTLFLSAKANDDFTNALNWNEYEEWNAGTNNYSVFRKTEGNWETNPLLTTETESTFLDTVMDLGDTGGKFCYYVMAVEDTGNIWGFSDTSISNVACVSQAPLLYLPGAFTPKGKNPVFCPIYSFADNKEYLFLIFDRWGKMIFETHDIKTGWDGTYGSADAPVGVYVYFIQFTDSNGKTVEKKGTVTLIR